MIIDKVPSILNTNWKAPKEKRKIKNISQVNNTEQFIFLYLYITDIF